MDEQNNTQTEKKSQTGSILAIVGIIVIVVAGIIGFQSMNKQQATTATTAAVQPTVAKTVEPTASQKSIYKDGKYSAVGSYMSPGGQEELGVTLTIQNGIVKDSEVTVKATRPESNERQTDFAANYKTEVVGKNLADLQLGKVSGSSLSPKGFNDAVDKIKAEAKS